MKDLPLLAFRFCGSFCVTSLTRLWGPASQPPAPMSGCPQEHQQQPDKVHAGELGLSPELPELGSTLWPGSQPLPQALASPHCSALPKGDGIQRQDLAFGRNQSTSRPVPNDPHTLCPGPTCWGPTGMEGRAIPAVSSIRGLP